ncbi:hypothetical protein H0X06_01375 [Candidatus Dependentiae bacterium]|nr:hypothetical protein [Candidatus Dependentiae bacterium]
MMKKCMALLLGGALISVNCLKGDSSVDMLVRAIQDKDRTAVERLLKRKNILGEPQRNRVCKAAEGVVVDCENSVVLLKSRWDALKFGYGLTLSTVGTALCGLGAFAFALTFEEGFEYGRDPDCENSEEQIAEVLIIAGLCFLVPGLYSTFSAWKCPRALNRLKQAEEIEAMVKNAPQLKEHTILS